MELFKNKELSYSYETLLKLLYEIKFISVGVLINIIADYSHKLIFDINRKILITNKTEPYVIKFNETTFCKIKEQNIVVKDIIKDHVLANLKIRDNKKEMNFNTNYIISFVLHNDIVYIQYQEDFWNVHLIDLKRAEKLETKLVLYDAYLSADSFHSAFLIHNNKLIIIAKMYYGGRIVNHYDIFVFDSNTHKKELQYKINITGIMKDFNAHIIDDKLFIMRYDSNLKYISVYIFNFNKESCFIEDKIINEYSILCYTFNGLYFYDKNKLWLVTDDTKKYKLIEYDIHKGMSGGKIISDYVLKIPYPCIISSFCCHAPNHIIMVGKGPKFKEYYLDMKARII